MLRPRMIAILAFTQLLSVPLVALAEAESHEATHEEEVSVQAAHEDGDHEAGEHDTGEEHSDGHGHGAHGELHLIDVLTNTEFIGSVVNFIGLVLILIWLGRKPLSNFLTSRSKAVEDGLAEAARMKEAAEAKYKEYSDRLEKLDEEVKKMREAILQAAQSERERITKEADQRSKRLAEETQRLIEQQMTQLYSDVMQEVVDASISAAETELREKMNPKDQQRLAREYLGVLAKTVEKEGDA